MTLQVVGYRTKKELKESIGKPLNYRETSIFGAEYRSNGNIVVAHRPSPIMNEKGREFFAEVEMENDRIKSVK